MLAPKPDYETRSTVKPTHAIAMSLDVNSLPHLFKVLSGLYTDKQLAVLRELSTNALDSHIEAGQTRPIEVTLPSGGAYGDNDLIIQDWGVGMSREDIENVYSQYGNSTKRETNTLNGTLGLGSKSPLTYTEQYTFIGVKDGIKTTVSVSMQDQMPTMNVLKEGETDEPNGVKVIIPARSYNQFEAKAEHLFRFWDPSTVLINGKPPRPIEGIEVTDRIMITKETEGRDYVIMAGVPYSVSFDHSLVREHALVAFVDTGRVAFVPSREGLDDSSNTREVLAALLAEYEGNVHTAVQRQIEQAEGPRDAFKALAAWRNALGAKALVKSEFKYKGRVIPVEFAPKGEKVTVTAVDSSKLSSAERMAAVKIETVVEALCVYGYNLSFTTSHKKKLLKYIEDNQIKGVRHVILADKKLPTHWLDKDRVVDWEVIRAIKLPRSGGQIHDPNRIPGSYDIYEQGDYNEGVPGDDIDQTSPIYWISTTGQGKPWQQRDYVAYHNVLLKKYKRRYTLVVLTDNRIGKFQRLFKCEPVARELGRIYKRIAKGVTDEMRMAQAIHKDYYLRTMFKKIDPTRLDDPVFAKLKKATECDISSSPLKALEAFSNVSMLGVTRPTSTVSFTDPMERYPLISKHDMDYASKRKLDHIYTYMNAVYADIQAQPDAIRDHSNERG